MRRNRERYRRRPFLEVLEDRLTPAVFNPVYTATFGDAVTADNAFTGADGNQYWTIDAGADRYQDDVYERPTAQTYQVRGLGDGSEQFAAAEYFENLDLVEARAGVDNRYLYVSLKLAGLDRLTTDGAVTTEGLVYQYGFRIARRAGGGGGLLVVADQPALKNPPGTEFGRVGTFIYKDCTRDVGGTGRSVTKEDRLAEVKGNGYERVVAADGRHKTTGQAILWARVSPDDPATVEFVLAYKALSYTRQELLDLPYFTVEANKGLKDPANYLWNDEYTKSEAGSPYRGTGGLSEFGTQGLGNIYELDTIDLGALFLPGSLSGTVYHDQDRNGVRDAGELGISNVEVTLRGTDFLGNAVDITVLTDADGFYRFEGLRPGTYKIIETQPASHEDGAETVGTINGELHGVLVANDIIGAIELGEDEDGINYDFGEVFAGS